MELAEIRSQPMASAASKSYRHQNNFRPHYRMEAMATAVETAAANGAAPRERNVIYEGDTVICQTSDGRMFFQAAKKDE